MSVNSGIHLARPVACRPDGAKPCGKPQDTKLHTARSPGVLWGSEDSHRPARGKRITVSETPSLLSPARQLQGPSGTSDGVEVAEGK